MNLSTSALFLVLIMHRQPIAALIVGYVLSVPYNVAVTVGVWRSAARHPGSRRWADFTRFATAIGMTVLSLT